jgi:hypothetical protein
LRGFFLGGAAGGLLAVGVQFLLQGGDEFGFVHGVAVLQVVGGLPVPGADSPPAGG